MPRKVETFTQINFGFLRLFVFELRGRAVQTNGQDGRTEKLTPLMRSIRTDT